MNKNQVDTLKNAIFAACTEVHNAAIKYQEAVSDNKEIQKLIPSLNKCMNRVKSISTPIPSLAGFIDIGAGIIALTIGLKTSMTISAAVIALYSTIIAIYDARKAEQLISANFDLAGCNSTTALLHEHNDPDVKAAMTQFITQSRPQPSAAS